MLESPPLPPAAARRERLEEIRRMARYVYANPRSKFESELAGHAFFLLREIKRLEELLEEPALPFEVRC